MHRKRISSLGIAGLILVILFAITFLNIQLSGSFIRNDEFAPKWSAASVWLKEGFSPYSEETQRETESLLKEYHYVKGEFDRGLFLEPVFNLYFYLPFSMFSYPTARAIWMTFIEIAIGLSAWISIRICRAQLKRIEVICWVILSFFWIPIFKYVLIGSALPIFICLDLLACYLALQKRTNAAGILLFLSIGNEPLSILIMIFLVIWSTSNQGPGLLLMYLSGLAFLIITSLILFPNWIPEWFSQFIAIYPDLTWIKTPISHIASLIPGAGSQIAAILHLLILFILLIEWYGISGKEGIALIWKTLLTLNLIYFINPFSKTAYLIFVWPALFMGYRFFTERWRISGKIIFWIGLIVLIYFYFRSVNGIELWSIKERSFMVLLAPCITLLGHQWTRWWALKSTKPVLDLRD